MKLAVASSVVFITMSYAVQAVANSPETSQVVTFCELAKDPSAFNGKRIRVRAIYRYAFESSRLEAPTCCPAERSKIWVEVSADLEGKSLKLFHKFPKAEGLVLATFEGTFVTGDTYGTFGERAKLTVHQIEKLEHTVRSSPKQVDPDWVPKDCEEAKS